MSRASSAWWVTHYGKPCISQDHVRVEWYPGRNDIIHRGTEPIWKALGAVMVAYNYRVPTSYTGSYNCRQVTGGSSWSGHAWPVAMDINAATNPYVNHAGIRTIRWGVETDMPAAMVREIESITASGIQAFRWGGRYRSIKDAMHYEIRVTLEEIAGGVHAPRGFYGGDTPRDEDEMSLKRGDSGNAVRKHQSGLNTWNPDLALVLDGDYGPATESAVKSYQGAADLDQTGVIDGVTSALIIAYTIPTSGGRHSHPAEAVVTEGTKVAVTIGESG